MSNNVLMDKTNFAGSPSVAEFLTSPACVGVMTMYSRIPEITREKQFSKLEQPRSRMAFRWTKRLQKTIIVLTVHINTYPGIKITKVKIIQIIYSRVKNGRCTRKTTNQEQHDKLQNLTDHHGSNLGSVHFFRIAL